MKLASTYEYDAPVEAVERALLDRAFWEQLQLSNMAPPRVVEADGTRIVVHMQFAGTLDAIGRRIVGKQQIEWNQTITVDPGTNRGTLSLSSRVRVNVSADGTFAFEALDGGRTRQTLRGELKVHVPLIGGKVESALGPGIQKSFDEQAASLRTWLTRG